MQTARRSLTQGGIKMFKRLNTEMLKEENYLETLAYIATRMMKYKTPEARETEGNRIDGILWNLADTTKAEHIDTDNLLRVSTAIQIMIDECYMEAWH